MDNKEPCSSAIPTNLIEELKVRTWLQNSLNIFFIYFKIWLLRRRFYSYTPMIYIINTSNLFKGLKQEVPLALSSSSIKAAYHIIGSIKRKYIYAKLVFPT
jgi:hypothetical protein